MAKQRIFWQGPSWYAPQQGQNEETWYQLERRRIGSDSPNVEDKWTARMDGHQASHAARQSGLGTPRFLDFIPEGMERQ